jgi:hypothetical protein
VDLHHQVIYHARRTKRGQTHGLPPDLCKFISSGKSRFRHLFHSFIKATNFASLQSAFHQWTKEHVRIEQGKWLNIDGKCIRSTEHQNSVSPVSLFCRKREQILPVEKIENKKGNGSDAVSRLPDIPDLKGAVPILDALHCKKNSKSNCNAEKPLCS